MARDEVAILVVDDELGMRTGVERALRHYTFHMPDIDTEVAFRIDQAESAEEALDKIRAQRPGILLLDQKLPGMSGLDLLSTLNGESNEILTIMITAYASIETAVVATKRGAYDFLPKPFTPEELKNVVRKAAGRLILTRQAHKLAEEKKRVRFEFIRVLGHELKAPINAVEGYLHTMESRILGEMPEGYGPIIERCIVRLDYMRKLIADLLDMTRIESGEKRRELVPLDVCEVAREAVETMQPEAARRAIAIRLDVPAPVKLLADRGEVQIVLNNLISNAVKYNRDGGRVDVAVRGDDGAAVISVADTGIGMSAQEVQKLFGEFVRIRNEKTRQILGSGLGLSIVKKIADLYGGEAMAESTPDVGSTFRVVLRQAAGAAAPSRNVGP